MAVRLDEHAIDVLIGKSGQGFDLLTPLVRKLLRGEAYADTRESLTALAIHRTLLLWLEHMEKGEWSVDAWKEVREAFEVAGHHPSEKNIRRPYGTPPAAPE